MRREDSCELADRRRLRRFLTDSGLDQQWLLLRKPSPGLLFAVALADWAIIFSAFLACANFDFVAPLALVAAGNRQRALGNLLHDAAHANYGFSREIGDRLAQCLLFLPLWSSMRLYRRDHFAHHKNLGNPEADVDFIHREGDRGAWWVGLWAREVFSTRNFLSSTFGHLGRATGPERAAMLLSSLLALGALGLAFGGRVAVEFAAFWLLARALVFHPLTMFREISDHVGLHPGTVLGFTRNHIDQGLLAQFFHPHNNGFHLVHHLDPTLPFYAWPRAHKLLMGWPLYAACAHTEHYFRGDHALVRSWVGEPAASNV